MSDMEARIAALEREAVRFADLRAVLIEIRDMGEPDEYSDINSVNRGDITDGCNAIDRIEQARAAREDSGGGVASGQTDVRGSTADGDGAPATPTPSQWATWTPEQVHDARIAEGLAFFHAVADKVQRESERFGSRRPWWRRLLDWLR